MDEQSVLRVIKKHLPVAVQDKVSAETRLFKEELIDSLGVINMLSDLEDEFKVHFSDEHLDAEILATPRCIYELMTELSRSNTK
jgi:acyl carrier protein